MRSSGELFRKAREKKQISQSLLAKKLGYSSSQMISNYERNIAPVPVNKLLFLSELLEVPLQKIIKAEVAQFRKDLTKNLCIQKNPKNS